LKKILFRADAKPSIGIGDLMSLITLGEYMEGFECFFLTQATLAAKTIVEKRGIKNVFYIDEDGDLVKDVEAINKIVDKYKIDVVFFEITERKLTEYGGVSSLVKKACVNFDGFILDDMELVVNWDAAAFSFYDEAKYGRAKFLLGTKYVILPKNFYDDDRIKKREYPQDRRNILIAMGGADELNFTLKVVAAFCDTDYKITIAVGSGYYLKDELLAFLETKTIEFELKVDVTDMLKEYLSCDFAIGAGGLTASELAASRTPCAILATYEHQIARCRYFDKNGWAKYLGFRNFDKSELLNAVRNYNKSGIGIEFKTKDIADALKKIGES